MFLVLQLLKEGNESVSAPPILEVCQLMVDCLVERVLCLDEAPGRASYMYMYLPNMLCTRSVYFFLYYFVSDNQRSSKQLVNCITTLYLFSKSKPTFLIHHAKTLQPYLSSKCTVSQ